jgi:hypothetical protein
MTKHVLVGLTVILLGAGCKPEEPQKMLETSATDDTHAGTSASDGSASSTSSASTTTTGTETGPAVTSGPDPSSSSTSTTGDPPPTAEEVCAQAQSRDECVVLEPAFEMKCIWGEVVDVALVDGECVIGPAKTGCQATLAAVNHGCFGFGPAACVQPGEILDLYYQEVRGGFSLWHELPGGCEVPTRADGTSPWTMCPHEEFEDPPDVCYCLCGGLPDETGTGP